MSWGGYVGAISIVLYVSFRSFSITALLFEKSNGVKTNPLGGDNDIIAAGNLAHMVGSTGPNWRILPS